MSEKYRQEIMFPQDNYVIRVTDEEFSLSKSSGNPMITLKFEVDRPEEIEVAGKMYNVAGVKTQPKWYPTQVSEDGAINADKSANSLENLKGLYTKFGIEIPENLDVTNPPLGFKGKLVHARLYGQKEEVRKSPTAAEVEAAKGTGKPAEGAVLKNPVTGQPLVKYQAVVAEIYGLADNDPAKPY